MVSSADKRVILVTGSNDGIGYEFVKQLAAAGHTVYLSSRNEKPGREAQSQLKAEGLNVKYVQLDVTDEKTILNAKALIEKEDGHLDVLVNNAGISGSLARGSAVELIPIMSTVLDTNLLGLIRTSTIFLPLLRKARDARGFANIVNITSDLASNTIMSDASKREDVPFVAYITSKAAVNSYTITLAHELRKERIRVNCVTPGLTNTKVVAYAGGKTPARAAKGLLPFVLLGEKDDAKTGIFANEHGPLPW